MFQKLNSNELTESFDQDQEIDLRQLSNAGLIKDCDIFMPLSGNEYFFILYSNSITNKELDSSWVRVDNRVVFAERRKRREREEEDRKKRLKDMKQSAKVKPTNNYTIKGGFNFYILGSDKNSLSFYSNINPRIELWSRPKKEVKAVNLPEEVPHEATNLDEDIYFQCDLCRDYGK